MAMANCCRVVAKIRLKMSVPHPYLAIGIDLLARTPRQMREHRRDQNMRVWRAVRSNTTIYVQLSDVNEHLSEKRNVDFDISDFNSIVCPDFGLQLARARKTWSWRPIRRAKMSFTISRRRSDRPMCQTAMCWCACFKAGSFLAGGTWTQERSTSSTGVPSRRGSKNNNQRGKLLHQLCLNPNRPSHPFCGR
jgi:hypothetical protein